MKTGFCIMLATLLTLFGFALNTSAQFEAHTQWHLPDGAKARLGKGRINEIAYSPDGTKLAVASNIGIWLYDAHTGQELNLLIGHTNAVENVAFSPDGNTLASGSRDNTLRLWDANTGEHIRALKGHTDSVRSVAFSPDGNTLASANEDEPLRLWDANTGEHIRTLKGHTGQVYSVAFSPDGNTIASGSRDTTLRLWDANTGEHTHSLKGHTGQVYSVAFSPDGNTIASGSRDTTLRLWDANTGEHIRTLKGHTDRVGSMAFSPDGNTLASGSLDETILLWAHTPSGTESVNVEPNGKQLVTLGHIKLNQPLQNYPNPFNPETWIPYQLSKPADVSISIYTADGKVVRTLDVGHQTVGMYQTRSRAAYWDGRNAVGEPVASDVYFYTLTAGDFIATRKMLIRK